MSQLQIKNLSTEIGSFGADLRMEAERNKGYND